MKLFSTKYSTSAFNAATFILRLGTGILMANIGYQKLVKFAIIKADFINFLGLGKSISLALVVFAEFFCSIFLILGLLTRLATIPLIITMGVALFRAHHGHIFTDGQTAALFLMSYIILLLTGPGKASVDGMIGK